jgi:Leucine-rich repeat (LRR) protein
MDLTAITDTKLDLYNNQIGDGGAKTLSLNTTLTTLNLGGNQIGAEGAKALSLNTTLTTLYLRYNRIGDEGAKALSLNTTLMTLDLGGNQIGDEGAKALNLNTTLTNLYLYDNRIGDEGAKALRLNTILTTLNLYNNQIGDEAQKEIQLQLNRNKEQLKKRRSQFISNMFLLNIAKNKNNSWSYLVPDIRNKILDIVIVNSSLGTTFHDAKACVKFISENKVTKSKTIIRGKNGNYRAG